MRKSEIHMHSTYSDGEFSPQELVDIASKNGVSIISLTDHDTFEGIEEFVAAGQAAGIDAFPGIEMTTRFRDFNVHLLVDDNLDAKGPENFDHRGNVAQVRDIADRHRIIGKQRCRQNGDGGIFCT